MAEQHFKRPPAVYPIVTQSLSMVQTLLQGHDLLAVLPLNLVLPQLTSGVLVELKTGKVMRMEPIGLLQPQVSIGQATGRLSQFLGASLPRVPARKGKVFAQESRDP